jgi:hypothetical protein
VARFILLLVLFTVIARMIWRFIDAIIRGASAPAAPGAQRSSAPTAVKMSQCPVCGTYVVPGKAISAASGGATIYFDSEKCRAEYQSR